MNTEKFGITDDGKVYDLRRRPLKLLGHIAYLLESHTLTAQQIKVWWKRQLASEEPVQHLVVLYHHGSFEVRVLEEVLVVSTNMDNEWFEAGEAA